MFSNIYYKSSSSITLFPVYDFILDVNFENKPLGFSKLSSGLSNYYKICSSAYVDSK